MFDVRPPGEAVRLIRTWPSVIPARRGHVVDDLEHVVLNGYDHTPLAAIDDDILLQEWDIALDYDDLRHFCEHARQEPGRVLVAPYKVYVPYGMWVHRRWDPPAAERSIRTGDATCQLFGFGIIYIPRGMIQQFVAAKQPGRWGDVEFSTWHFEHVTPDVPICWDVHPVHLHYPLYFRAELG